MIFQPKNHFVYKLVVFCCASYAADAAQVQRLASGTRGIATIAPMKSYDRARAKVGLAVILWPGHRFNVVLTNKNGDIMGLWRYVWSRDETKAPWCMTKVR